MSRFWLFVFKRVFRIKVTTKQHNFYELSCLTLEAIPQQDQGSSSVASKVDEWLIPSSSSKHFFQILISINKSFSNCNFLSMQSSIKYFLMLHRRQYCTIVFCILRIKSVTQRVCCCRCWFVCVPASYSFVCLDIRVWIGMLATKFPKFSNNIVLAFYT